jgi:hypothetical protein
MLAVLPLIWMTVENRTRPYGLDTPNRRHLPLAEALSEPLVHAYKRQIPRATCLSDRTVQRRFTALHVRRCVYYPTQHVLSIENRPLRVFILTCCQTRAVFRSASGRLANADVFLRLGLALTLPFPRGSREIGPGSMPLRLSTSRRYTRGRGGITDTFWAPSAETSSAQFAAEGQGQPDEYIACGVGDAVSG